MDIERYSQKMMQRINHGRVLMFGAIKNTLGLSFVMAKADFKLRNEGSYLGIFWYLLNPILTFSLLYVIFSQRLGADVKNYPLYLLLGIIMFNFFQSASIESTKSIIKDNRGLIKSINFPRESLIGALVLKNIFSHIFEIILFLVALVIFNSNPLGVCFYFIVLIFFCLFIFGFCLILSSLTVFFYDLENIWNFAVRLLWLATPIFYAIESQKLFYLNLLNPLYYFITISREVVIYGKIPSVWLFSGAFLCGALFLFSGLFIFSRLKNKFAEMI